MYGDDRSQQPTTAAMFPFGSAAMYGFESPSLLQEKLDLVKEWFQLGGIHYLSQLKFATHDMLALVSDMTIRPPPLAPALVQKGQKNNYEQRRRRW